MAGSKKAYLLMAAIAAAFMGYVVYTYFIYDPEAARFLSHKENLSHRFNLHSWLTVMKLHVGFACVATVTGLVNFSTAFLQKYRKLHRWNGYVYAASVLVVIVTSGYMAPHATGGKVTSIAFNSLNILWAVITLIAILKIRKKQVDSHRRWMIRSFAFVFTNMSIHLLTALLHQGIGLDYTSSYTIGVYGSIVLLLLAAELVIRTVPVNARPKI